MSGNLIHDERDFRNLENIGRIVIQWYLNSLTKNRHIMSVAICAISNTNHEYQYLAERLA